MDALLFFYAADTRFDSLVEKEGIAGFLVPPARGDFEGTGAKLVRPGDFPGVLSVVVFLLVYIFTSSAFSSSSEISQS